MIQAKSILIISSLSTLLVACGGGGGSSTGGQTTDLNTLVTSVPTPTYSASSASGDGNATVYLAINNLRAKIGSGLLQQNTALDASALAHWNYISTDPTTLIKSHNEISSNPGFTGVDPTARAIAAGYEGTVGELIYGLNVVADWKSCATNWTNSVYHASIVFSGARDIGITAQTTTQSYPPYGKYTVCIVELGLTYGNAEQLPDDGTIRVYPYEEEASVPRIFYNQTETPVPLPDYSELGTPILLNFKTKSFATGATPVIAISQLTVTPSGGTALPAKILTKQMISNGPVLTGDSNLDAFTAALVPTSPLQPNTLYNVSFIGSVNGVSATKSWSFTTGS